MEFNYIEENNKIIIPEGVKEIPDYAFFNNDKIKEVILPSTVTYIGESAFKNCKNLRKINLPDSINWINDCAFQGCISLEEISLPKIELLSSEVFSGCTSLRKITLNEGLKHIDSFALLGCINLEEITFPNSLKSIGRMAFMNCEKIEELYIPKNVEKIDTAAFAYTKSLKKIIVDKNNKKYLSDEDDTLIDKDGLIVQYALSSPKETYIIGYYKDYLENHNEDIETTSTTYNIGDYAFAGATNLKEMYLNSEFESFASHTFEECPNLKKLIIFHSNYGAALLFHIYQTIKEDINIPFEEITLEDGIDTICGGTNELFKNAKIVNLPSTLECINEEVFTKSTKLKRLNIPSSIKTILPNTFINGIVLNFEGFGEVSSNNFNMLQTKTSPEYYLRNNAKNNIRIFSLKDGTYYIKYNDYDTIVITQDEISRLSKTAKELKDEPDTIIEYIIRLMAVNRTNHELLNRIWSNKDLEELFSKFINDYETAKNLASKKIASSIKDIIEKSGVTDEFLFSSILIRNIEKKSLIKILENYNESISRFFRLSTLCDEGYELNVDKLLPYCALLEKYKRYDRFFYNPVLFEKTNIRDQELLISHFNKNIKKLLINSKTLNDTYGNNMKDLLKLCNCLGVFSDNEKLSQRMSTFINEKMFNNEEDSITGNTVHTMFSDIEPRDEIDYEFIEFFIDNYDKLIEEEKKTSGIISRIYNSFREISKTSTSHRGEQRHLKVTLDKCLNFFIIERFTGVTEENKELAYALQKHYSEPYALQIGEMIINQSKDAPRNIFGEIDLKEKEPINGFSYEWLPKQDHDNLVLGKYCSCCAHILGAGAGIMRASMITDNHQNLVIRNKDNEIIAKMTIYINKEKGYAVYNTAEINTNYRSFQDLKNIYEAFIRGTMIFIEEYNKNNKIPISTITIGEYRNTLKFNLGNIETKILDTPNYSNYGYFHEKRKFGTYDGDSKEKQILVYKK